MSFLVSTLPGPIETGQIGLPALQPPFVWANTQVRDLFDSLYRVYPAGFFLLCEARAIANRCRLVPMPRGRGLHGERVSVTKNRGRREQSQSYNLLSGTREGD